MDQDPQATFDQLCAFAQDQVKKKRVPGTAIGVLDEGQVYTAGFGVTSVENPLPVTDRTVFQIGSITKTFTCLAAMRLVEMGKLDLQATVRTYLPGFRVQDETASAGATIWHLLTHMSGWTGDLFEDTGSGADAMPRYMALMADLEQQAPLGTVWSYNNAGFCLAGYIIEQVTGKSYEAIMQELVLGPLGLDCCYFDPGQVITHRFAVGHSIEGERIQVSRPWPLPRVAYPAGGITCDVHMLLHYAQFQMGDGAVEGEDKRLLQPETMAQMHTPQVNIWGDRQQMALAWFVDDVGGARQLSHGGSTNGQISLLAIYPEQRLALAVVTNADAGGGITDAVRRWVLEHYLGLQYPKPQPIEATAEELSAYVGRYTQPAADIELALLCGRLIGQTIPKIGFPSWDVPPPPSPPPVALTLCEPDRLIVTQGPSQGALVDVIRTPDGAIGWLRLGRLYRRQPD